MDRRIKDLMDAGYGFATEYAADWALDAVPVAETEPIEDMPELSSVCVNTRLFGVTVSGYDTRGDLRVFRVQTRAQMRAEAAHRARRDWIAAHRLPFMRALEEQTGPTWDEFAAMAL